MGSVTKLFCESSTSLCLRVNFMLSQARTYARYSNLLSSRTRAYNICELKIQTSPEPKKSCVLVRSAQKGAKNKRSKKLTPKTRFLDDSRGVSGKCFLNPKLTFIAFSGHFFRKFARNFLQRLLRRRFRVLRAKK